MFGGQARALKKRYGHGAMSPSDVLNSITPPYDLGIKIRDARGARRIVQKDLEGVLRIPRGGAHQAELVATMRHYDGATSGGDGVGYYTNIFVAWRHGTATYRSGGVRVLPFEAERIARALERGTGTRPGDAEPDRLVGTGSGNASELCATAVAGGAVLLYVVFEGQGGVVYRSRGVDVKTLHEREAVAAGLRRFAAMRGRAR